MRAEQSTIHITLASLPTSGDMPTWTTRQLWKLSISLALSALLWLCDWTDYSLAGTWPDLALPFIGLKAGTTLLDTCRIISQRAIHRIIKILAIATLLEGAATVTMGILLATVPLVLIPAVATAVSEKRIVSVPSPDGTRVMEEYRMGDGILIVRVKDSLVPLLERDIYRGADVFPESTRWVDNDTLSIPGTSRPEHLGWFNMELAPHIQLGVLACKLLGILISPPIS